MFFVLHVVALQRQSKIDEFLWEGVDEPVEFDSWSSGQPASAITKQCVLIDNNKGFNWLVESCDLSAAFICEYGE